MLVLDGARVAFRSVQLRPRNPACAVCGDAPTLARVADVDYPLFCGAPAHDAGTVRPRRTATARPLTRAQVLAILDDPALSVSPSVRALVSGRPLR
jgi:hypothetical protein